MKIKEAVQLEKVAAGRQAFRWTEVLNALLELKEGMALPVELDDIKEAISLQTWALHRNGTANGPIYRAQRSGSTVYISKVSENGNTK